MKDTPTYIDRINAYWNWRMFNSVSDKAQALYFALLHCANRAGFPNELCVPNSTLLSMVNISLRELFNVRNTLEQVGLVEIVKGKKGQAATYKFRQISELYCTNSGSNSFTNTDTNSFTNTDTNSSNIYRQRQDEDIKEVLPNGNTKKSRFIPPTVDAVSEYCLERNNGIDAQAFVDFYTANGWVQGKGQKPIRDWKACIRTWEQKRKQEPAKDHFAAAKSFFGVEDGGFIDI